MTAKVVASCEREGMLAGRDKPNNFQGKEKHC